MKLLGFCFILLATSCCLTSVYSRGRHVIVEKTSTHRRLHVRMFYSTAGQNYAIRNANTPTGDGTFSVAGGGCGGANTFGSNGVTEVADGAKVTLRIEYNGGHASNANQFKMYFGCGANKNGPTQEVPAANCDQPYPATAPQGSGSGPQTISCTLPTAAGETDCAVSLQDQRNWGGCADLKIAANAAPGGGDAESPIPPPAAGANGDVVKPTGNQDNCCSLTKADIQVNKKSEKLYEFIGTASGTCTGQEFSSITLPKTTASLVLDGGGTTYRAKTDANDKAITIKYDGGEEPFEISLNENVLELTNVGTSLPKVCDGKISLTSGSGKILGMDTGVFVVVLILVLILIGAGTMMYLRSTREDSLADPKPAVSVEMKNPAAGGQKPLAAGWEAVVDKESGDTYYHNKQSGETTWNRPT